MVRRDAATADALFAWLSDHPAADAALEQRLASSATPLLAAIAAWPDRPEPAQRLLEITVRNLLELAAVVSATGWPGLTRVGALGADAAWLVAQHGDAADPVREGLLGPLAAAVAAGEADPRHFACLADRHAVVRGRPQPYGTVIEVVDGAARFPHPVLRPSSLARRRGQLGLPAIADELPLIEAAGDLVPFGPERAGRNLLAWPPRP